MKNIAIVPARGGSKRIPRKNIKDFLGKPIISYSIAAALDSNLFDEVMVSTDDNEIAEIAKEHGASVPFFRSGKNSNDYATTADVLIEVLNKYKENNKNFDYLCCIYPTAPFITKEKLYETFSMILEEQVDSVIPVVKYSYPIQRSFRITSNNRLEYIQPENIHKRSQDLQPIYHDAGQFYWCKVNTFLRKKYLITKDNLPYILNKLEVQDIDTEEDWEIAEIKYQILKRRENEKRK
ncbi:MAG: pseudaminic acid cytidylyltransferase [Ignavibacteriales bacterium]|nr:pseudaminic acid cytidylyltransferase [Ignavibacteriales bacterium]